LWFYVCQSSACFGKTGYVFNSSTRGLPCLTDAAPYEEIEITMIAARAERAQEES